LSSQKNLLKSRLKTRPLPNAVRRGGVILARYGLTPYRYSGILHKFVETVQRFNAKPTFPVTASVVQHHKKLFRDLGSLNIELAVHGLEHIDYSVMSIEEFQDHIKKAMKIFQEAEIPVNGYRFPYMRRTEGYIQALADAGLEWDSSEVISCNSLNPDEYPENGWESYQQILATYEPKDAAFTPAMPFFSNQLIELPVSVPDDDILVDRLGLADGRRMQSVWCNMVYQVRDRGELLVLQIHPERYEKVEKSLTETLKLVETGGDAWIASLGEIAGWWREKRQFQLEIIREDEGYRIENHCPDHATVMIMNSPWNDEKCTNVKPKSWTLNTRHKPVIGLSMNASDTLARFLQNEGFLWERCTAPDQVSCYIDYSGLLNEQVKTRLLQAIHDCGEPILRFGRWPNGAAYAVSVSGDIDGVDLWDFWRRFYG